MTMWIVDRSKQAADNGEAWRDEDHAALVEHLRKVDETAEKARQEAIEEAIR